MQLLSRIAALPYQNYVLSFLQTSFFSQLCVGYLKRMHQSPTPHSRWCRCMVTSVRPEHCIGLIGHKYRIQAETLNTANDGWALCDLHLAAAVQQPWLLRCRTPSASAANPRPSKVQPFCCCSSSI